MVHIFQQSSSPVWFRLVRVRKEERERGLEKQAETFFKVAERFEKEGKTDLAKKWLEKTIQIAPGSGPAKKAREMLDKLKE